MVQQLVIVSLKEEMTAQNPSLGSKGVTDGRKCPRRGTQKWDLL